MKWFKPRFVVVLLLGLLVTELAWAHGYQFRHGHRHHAHVGIAIGVPLLIATWRYPPPQIYTYPPVVTLQSPPQAYIEMSDMNARQQQRSDGWWYYCHNPDGYYPYVKECPQGWQQVEPRPSDLR